MAMRTPKQQEQTKLWQLLGQVTAAQRWHMGMLQAIDRQGFGNRFLDDCHAKFIDELKVIEQNIRKKMQEIK